MTSRAVRKLNSVLSDALLKAALDLEPNPRPGMPIRKRIQRVADAIMTRAELGDVQAASFIADRLEGKAVQQVSVETDARMTVTLMGMHVRSDQDDTQHAQPAIEAGFEEIPPPPLPLAHPSVPDAHSAPVPETPADRHADLRARILASLHDG